MGYRYNEFAPGEVYHVFTRGVEKRKVFLSTKDRQRFIGLLRHYLPAGEVVSFSTARKLRQPVTQTSAGAGLVDLLCYCLMDNHVHLLVQENLDRGVSTYMRRLLNAYARYFNTKQQRSGSLWLNPFKAVLVDDDEQLLHVARYIHLNPYVAHLTDDALNYPWSSLEEYLQSPREKFCHTNLVSSLLKPTEHKKFLLNEADYARSLTDTKHLLIDFED